MSIRALRIPKKMREQILKVRAAFLLVFLIMLPSILRYSPYPVHIMVMSCMFVALATSYDLIFGYTGMLSLAHTAAFGVGAYTSAILTTTQNLPIWIDLPAAGILTGLLAFLIGIPALRLSRTSFIIVTLAYFQILHIIANNWIALTNGPGGIPGIPPISITMPLIGDIRFITRHANYYLNLAFALLVIYLSIRLVKSRIGRILIAIREDELLAQSFGINTFKYKLLIFILASAMAGMVGSLFAHYIHVVTPEIFDFFYVTRLLVIVITGGIGTIWGAVVGAVVFTVIPEALRIASEFREIMLGIVFVSVMLYMPTGIVSKWKGIKSFFEELPVWSFWKRRI